MSKFNYTYYSTPILYQLHWLPIVERINFKILLFTFQCLKGSAPAYLKELTNIYNQSRSLRSNAKSLLTKPSINTKFYGCRSFQFASAHLWNNLPSEIKEASSVNNFKSILKTYLFQSYFS